MTLVIGGSGAFLLSVVIIIIAALGGNNGGSGLAVGAPTDQASGAEADAGLPSGSPDASASASASPGADPSKTQTASGGGSGGQLPPGTGVPSSWPTPSTTGWQRTGVALAPYSSGEELVIERSGTVIDSADIQARIRVLADNVTIKRSRIRATKCGDPDGCAVIWLEPGRSGLVLEDVEVSRTAGATNIDRAVSVAENGGSPSQLRAVVRRAYVHNTYRGILVGDNTLIEDSYIDDMDSTAPSDAHTAAVTAHGGRNVTLRHNAIGLPPSGTSSAGVSLYGDTYAIENLLIEGNLLNGGTSCLWLTTDFTRGANTYVAIRNNMFGTKYYSSCGMYEPAYIVPRDAAGPGFTFSGNTWYAPGTSKHGTPVTSSGG